MIVLLNKLTCIIIPPTATKIICLSVAKKSRRKFFFFFCCCCFVAVFSVTYIIWRDSSGPWTLLLPFNLFVMFGSLFELKNANFGIFLQPKIDNQGQKLMSEAMFYGNCFTERKDLYTKAVLRFFIAIWYINWNLLNKMWYLSHFFT